MIDFMRLGFAFVAINRGSNHKFVLLPPLHVKSVSQAHRGRGLPTAGLDEFTSRNPK